MLNLYVFCSWYCFSLLLLFSSLNASYDDIYRHALNVCAPILRYCSQRLLPCWTSDATRKWNYIACKYITKQWHTLHRKSNRSSMLLSEGTEAPISESARYVWCTMHEGVKTEIKWKRKVSKRSDVGQNAVESSRVKPNWMSRAK